MLPNAIPLIAAASDGVANPVLATPATVSLVDVDNGRSRRKLAISPTSFIELSIANQSSTENGTEVPTTRFVVRMDHSIYASTLSKPRWIKQSSYLVVTQPASSLFPGSNAVDLVTRLFTAISGGGLPNAYDWSVDDIVPFTGSYGSAETEFSALKTGLGRILNGEL